MNSYIEEIQRRRLPRRILLHVPYKQLMSVDDEDRYTVRQHAPPRV
jgi:hypothetical protein